MLALIKVRLKRDELSLPANKKSHEVLWGQGLTVDCSMEPGFGNFHGTLWYPLLSGGLTIPTLPITFYSLLRNFKKPTTLVNWHTCSTGVGSLLFSVLTLLILLSFEVVVEALETFTSSNPGIDESFASRIRNVISNRSTLKIQVDWIDFSSRTPGNLPKR